MTREQLRGKYRGSGWGVVQRRIVPDWVKGPIGKGIFVLQWDNRNSNLTFVHRLRCTYNVRYIVPQ